MEMIELYLEQTPALISNIKKSLTEKDWDSLHAAAHKMIPSFSIMGIGKDYEMIAKQIQEYTGKKDELKKNTATGNTTGACLQQSMCRTKRRIQYT